MRVEIDQSGHIEYTSNDTVLGDSLGNSILIKSRDKKITQKFYREAGKPRQYLVQVFSLLTVLLIKESFKPTNSYVIDIEYPGRDSDIRNFLMQFSQRLSVPLEKSQISFGLVGKKSLSHKTAYLRFKGKTSGMIIRYKRILNIILP